MHEHQYEVEKDGEFYLIRITSLGPDAVTQARTVDEVQSMALDYIAVTTGVEETDIDITATTWHMDIFEALGMERPAPPSDCEHYYSNGGDGWMRCVKCGAEPEERP